MSDAPDVEIGSQIRAMREAAGLSQGQLAEMAGTNQQTVQRIESGATGISRATPKLLEALKHIGLRTYASSDEFIRAYMTERDAVKIKREILKKKHAPDDDKFERFSFQDRYFFYFSNEIEPGLMEIEKNKHIKFNPMDLIPESDRFLALYVPTSDMEPEFEPGDIILADTLVPPIPNVTCIFLNDSEKGKVATVKRLVSSTKDEWSVKSWSPPREFKLPKTSWPTCVRTVGKFSRR